MIEYADWKAAASDDAAPEFVKRAELDETNCSTAFADVVHDSLPCGSAAETWLSARAFSKMAAAGEYSGIRGLEDDIRGRIEKAASLFGISECVVGDLATKKAEAQEHDDSEFGWVGNGERKYPLFDAGCVKKAFAYFEDNKYKYPFVMRSSIAKRIIEKAAEFGIPQAEIPDGIRKTAGHGLARPDNVINELVVRAETCKNVDAAMALAAAAEKVAELGMDALTGGAAEKIAELVEDADVIDGVHTSYGYRAMAPEDFLFDIDIKTAEDSLRDTIEIGGDLLSLRKLAELPDELFDGVFGDGFSDSCKTAGAIDPGKLGHAISERPVEDVNELANTLRSL